MINRKQNTKEKCRSIRTTTVCIFSHTIGLISQQSSGKIRQQTELEAFVSLWNNQYSATHSEDWICKKVVKTLSIMHCSYHTKSNRKIGHTVNFKCSLSFGECTCCTWPSVRVESSASPLELKGEWKWFRWDRCNSCSNWILQ